VIWVKEVLEVDLTCNLQKKGPPAVKEKRVKGRRRGKASASSILEKGNSIKKEMETEGLGPSGGKNQFYLRDLVGTKENADTPETQPLQPAIR